MSLIPSRETPTIRDVMNSSAILTPSSEIKQEEEAKTSPCGAAEQRGLRIESIVPCFISKYVKNYCDTAIWRSWQESVDSTKNLIAVSAEEGFTRRMQEHIRNMKPSAIETFAAVVMADVSGYSKLSSSLSARGAEGAEILCRTMKGYLDKVPIC